MKEYWKKKKFKVLSEGGEIIERYFPVPVDKLTEESFKKWKENKDYQTDRKEIRNPFFHKKYMKLIRFCFNNLPEKYSIHLTTFEQTRSFIEWEARIVEYYWSPPVTRKRFHRDKFVKMLGNEKYNKETIISLLDKATEKEKASEIRMKPKSIAFDKMDNDEFREVYQRVLDTVMLILKVDNKSIEEELNRFAF